MEFAVWDILLYSNLTPTAKAPSCKHDADGRPGARLHAHRRFRGVPAPVATCPTYASDVGGKLAKGHAFAATYYDTLKDAAGRCGDPGRALMSQTPRPAAAATNMQGFRRGTKPSSQTMRCE